MMAIIPTLAIHGGAGTIPADTIDAEMVEAYHRGLCAALHAGGRALAKGGAALDAVIEAVKILEDDPLFNAGRGAVFTTAETLEMDAAVMRGSDRAAGAVAGICGPCHPVEAARLVMEQSGHVLMIGAGAEAFLREAGVEFLTQDHFATEWRLDALRRELARRASGAPDTRTDADRHGTVGAVARDATGNLAAATSTGGYTAKRPGRVGDAPVIGAGTFADNATCAVSTTGNGEVFIRFTAAAELAARLRYTRKTLPQAAGEIIDELAAHGGDGGLIAVAGEGPPVLPFNSNGMYRGFTGADGALWTALHKENFRRTEAGNL
jgi:beta-aspartyl-peptidase (threonine type)